MFRTGLLTFIALFLIWPYLQSQNMEDIEKSVDHVVEQPMQPRRSFADEAGEPVDRSVIFMQNVPDQFAKQVEIACRSFPELQNCDIEIVYDKISTTMAARPSKIAGKRKYKIFINSDPDFEGIKFETIPFNAQVGILCHELCHILDYEFKSGFGILGRGFAYLTKPGKRRYEKSIDFLTIEKGLGWQLHDWARFGMYDSAATDEYKEFKKDIYLEPEEIVEIMRSRPEYAETFTE